jgi:Na+/phosphate symporter
MQETRHQFHESLIELEQQTLGGLDMVLQQLDRALESVTNQDVELAEMVIADDDRIDASYVEAHQGALSLLARQTPVAGDLRIVAALLHISRCVERMGDQCANIAKLVQLSGAMKLDATRWLERGRNCSDAAARPRLLLVNQSTTAAAAAGRARMGFASAWRRRRLMGAHSEKRGG